MRNIIGKFLCGSDLFVCATFICVIVEILQFFVCVFMLVFQRKIGVISPMYRVFVFPVCLHFCVSESDGGDRGEAVTSRWRRG